MIDQFGIFTEITSGASIENVGFVDTYVQTVMGLDLPDYATGFLATRMFGNAVVRNCIFQGLASDSPRTYTINKSYDTHGLVTGIYYKDGAMPTIEDCAMPAKTAISGRTMTDLSPLSTVSWFWVGQQRIMSWTTRMGTWPLATSQRVISTILPSQASTTTNGPSKSSPAARY